MTRGRVKILDQNTSRYEKIAVDIAYSISQGEWQEGDTIKGRSTLSGKYSVSSETIRRAVSLLHEFGVVEVIERKGIVVLSQEKAKEYILEFQHKDKILLMRENLKTLMEERQAIDTIMNAKIDHIIEQAMILRNSGMINPLEAKITKGSKLIGHTVGEVQFWKHTGATIIAIQREGHLVLSPGPELIFYEGDIIMYVGNADDNVKRVEDFVSPKESE
ncbi:TrkA C-terminal domain-containing protein [Guggenheimella bovis]